MPLFNYKCDKCEIVIEKYVNPGKNPKVNCPECDGDLEKVFGSFCNRTWRRANENFDEVLDPEIERIRKKIREGSDNDFLDIAGDIY